MVNDINRFYMLARRLNRESIEVKFFINHIDTTTELCLHTNMNMKKINKSEFEQYWCEQNVFKYVCYYRVI